MFSTQLDKTIDDNDMTNKISQEGDDEETVMANLTGKHFHKRDGKYQTIQSPQGRAKFANMNKTGEGQMKINYTPLKN